MGKKNKEYVLKQEKKEQLQALTLLDLMVNRQHSFPIILEDDDVDLEPLFRKLLAKNHVDIDGKQYVVTQSGRQLLRRYLERDTELIRVFEAFCAVDMQEGAFAYSSLFDMEEDEFADFLSDGKWEDLRLIVLEFKNKNQKNASEYLDPIDLVFADFLKNGRIDFSLPGWQFDLCSDLMWDEMVEIIDSAYNLDELRANIAKDKNAEWTADDLMEAIIRQGNEVMRANFEEERRLRKEAEEEAKKAGVARESEENEEDFEEIVIVEQPLAYYDPYINPFYISPLLYVSLWDDPYY